jgi:adenosine deaminase
MRDLAALPKVELHVHLEGAIRIETVRELADRNGVAVSPALTSAGWQFRDSLDFIEQYVAMCNLLTRVDDFRRTAYEFCEDLALAGVRYAEAAFSPSNHAERMNDWFGPIEAALDGLAAGEQAFGVRVRLCPDIVRDLGMEPAERVLQVALEFAGRGVIGLNAAGSERADVAPFGALFRRAKQAGLRSVPHAGEWAGPASVWQTLASYEPDRLGHGVRSIEDGALIEHLAEAHIPLEVCPVSNIATGVYPSLEEHPLPRLLDAGVIVTLNSDDPALFGAWLDDVYATARDAWGYSDGDLAAFSRAGVAASFADADLKRDMFAGIDAWLAPT